MNDRVLKQKGLEQSKYHHARCYNLFPTDSFNFHQSYRVGGIHVNLVVNHSLEQKQYHLFYVMCTRILNSTTYDVHHANEPHSRESNSGEIRRCILCHAPLLHLLRGPLDADRRLLI